jgi:hypothetical protein
MTERLLQFIWQFQYFNKVQLQTIEGEEVAVVFPGHLNKDQGPDFLDARVKIGKTILAGSVELHLKTSNWEKHKHTGDINYRNVILHVVYINDVNKSPLPILELHPRISKIMIERYEFLMNNSGFIACESAFPRIKEITWASWKERLLIERLCRKSLLVTEYLEKKKNDWQESFWRLLARNFGFKVNAEAFESIAASVPLKLLAKHKSSIHQIEALLLGQAGLLKGSFQDDYAKLLEREYRYLSKKYNLTPVLFPIQSLRMRPGNFPAIRLAQLSMLIHKSNYLLAQILEMVELEGVKNMLRVTANDYWHYRYDFDKPTGYRPKKLGEEMVNNIIINSIVPILFSHGKYHENEAQKLKALSWLESINAEKNNITRRFTNLGVCNRSAYDSQSLIELKTQYCDVKRCLECSIGNSLLKYF